MLFAGINSHVAYADETMETTSKSSTSVSESSESTDGATQDISAYDNSQSEEELIEAYDDSQEEEYLIEAYDDSLNSLQSPVADAKPEIALESIDVNTGDFVLKLSNLRSLNEGDYVTVPIWSDAKQADIVWYNPEYTDGIYYVRGNISNHKYNFGTYNAHVYIRNGNSAEFECGMSFAVALGCDGITVSGDTDQKTVMISGVKDYNAITKISYAVWSDVNGQDDCRWYDASETQSGVYSGGFSVRNHKGTGNYNVHCYALTRSGQMVFVGATNFVVDSASAESVSTSEITNAGQFDITISGVKAPYGISNIRAAVWSKTDQSDLIWYNCTKVDQSYKATAAISNHKYYVGNYNIHVYLQNADGDMEFIGATNKDCSIKSGTVKINQDKSSLYYPVSLSDFNFYNTVQSISFGIWGNAGGQNDLTWYDASLVDGAYLANFEVANHMERGEYNVHVYAKMKDGSTRFITAANFSIDNLPTESVTVSDINNSGGTFKININVVRKLSNVKSVKAGVWSKGDQSDFMWYTASVQADGTYCVNADVKNHGYDFGKYYIHVYVEDKNGNMSFAAGTEADIQPVNYVKYEQISECLMRITVYGAQYNGAAADSVQFPTWSEENGQDDIVWYNGEKNSDGSFSINIYRGDFRVDGTYDTHIYVDGKGFIYGLSYKMKIPTDYNSYAAEVMRNIIYAVETGGQIYGNQRYDDFTMAFNSSSNERAITIGAGQWYATEAKRLLNEIRSSDPATFARYDTAGIGTDLDNANWSIYGSDGTVLTQSNYKSERDAHRTITTGSAKAVAIQNIIKSDAGIAVQNRLTDVQMAQYVDEAAQLNVTDLKARMFCANIRHLGGLSSMKRVINNCISDGLSLTMENLWSTMLKHDNQNSDGNQVGSPIYHTRHIKVMSWLNKYIG